MNKKVTEICANCGGTLEYPFYPGLPTMDGKQFCSIQCAEEQGYKWSNYLDKLLTTPEKCSGCKTLFEKDDLVLAANGDLLCPECLEAFNNDEEED